MRRNKFKTLTYPRVATHELLMKDAFSYLNLAYVGDAKKKMKFSKLYVYLQRYIVYLTKFLTSVFEKC